MDSGFIILAIHGALVQPEGFSPENIYFFEHFGPFLSQTLFKQTTCSYAGAAANPFRPVV